MANTTKALTDIYEGFTMDFTSKIHWSQRADGQWFRRMQSKTIYGYRWSAWAATTTQPPHLVPAQYAGKARLPRA